jgi:uncharacterized protein
MTDPITIPAGRGVALRLAAGTRCRVVNAHGTQVVDVWALTDDPSEYLSMAHSREVIQRIYFRPGDTLLSNNYRPMLTVTADTSPGCHDSLIAACSREMYERMGADASHPSCAGNLRTEMRAMNLEPGHIPAPWNLFMSARVEEDGTITYARPRSRPGDYVELTTQCELILVLSACPDDLYPTNGGDGRPRDAQLRIIRS